MKPPHLFPASALTLPVTSAFAALSLAGALPSSAMALEQKLSAADGAAGDQLGRSVAIDGGGNDRLTGDGGNDVLKGRSGNDKLNGAPAVTATPAIPAGTS